MKNGASVVGKTYEVGGKVFKVLDVEAYPKAGVSKRYQGILVFRAGVLVAVNYRGTLIPNITMMGGVVRLSKVELNNQVITGSKAISNALGITEAMVAYELKKL